MFKSKQNQHSSVELHNTTVVSETAQQTGFTPLSIQMNQSEEPLSDIEALQNETHQVLPTTIANRVTDHFHVQRAHRRLSRENEENTQNVREEVKLIADRFVNSGLIQSKELKSGLERGLLEHIFIPTVKVDANGKSYISGGHSLYFRGKGDNNFDIGKAIDGNIHGVKEYEIRMGIVEGRKTMFPDDKMPEDIIRMADYAFQNLDEFDPPGFEGDTAEHCEGLSEEGIRIHFVINQQGIVTTFFPICKHEKVKKPRVGNPQGNNRQTKDQKPAHPQEQLSRREKQAIRRDLNEKKALAKAEMDARVREERAKNLQKLREKDANKQSNGKKKNSDSSQNAGRNKKASKKGKK